MANRKRFMATMIIPALLAVLACPAWAATSGGKGSHYPGRDCSECHKIPEVSTGKAPSKSVPAKAITGKGAAGSETGATPAKRATQPR